MRYQRAEPPLKIDGLAAARTYFAGCIADAANLGSAGIVLAHNHPSGDARPSDSDFRATRRLAVAAEAIDCSVLDHLVFGASDCTSMRQLGYL